VVYLPPPKLTNDPPVDTPRRFCLGCNYPLDGLDVPRCPECGRVFDLQRPSTYSTGEGAPGRLLRLCERIPPNVLALIELIILFAVGYFLMRYPLGGAFILFLPFWKVTEIWLALRAMQNERLHGLPLWVLAATFSGAILCAPFGSFAIYIGLVLGPLVGVVRSYVEA